MLSTNNIKLESAGKGKSFTPGNLELKINSIELEANRFEPNSYFLILNMETKPLDPPFEGWLIDKDDPSKGTYAGQTGRVKANAFAFKDSVLRNGTQINRDESIMRFIGLLCKEIGKIDWFNNADGKYATIEDFVQGFNESKVFKDIYLHTCIGARKYKNAKQFDAYDMYFPKYDKSKVAFSLDPSKVQKFDEKVHIYEKESESLAGFDGNNAPEEQNNLSSDFSL